MKLPVKTTAIQARYFDTDAVGHISSNAYVHYMEIGRSEYMMELSRRLNMPSSVVANINVDYVSETFYGEDIKISCWCSRVGSKSLTISNVIYAGERVVSRGTATLVGFDQQTRKSVAFPAELEAVEFSPEG